MGTRSKKLPPTNSSRSPKIDSSRTVSGRSKTIPRIPGCTFRNSASREPLPPPTSTIVSSPRHAIAFSRSIRASDPWPIARSKRARSSGCWASHDQKSVPYILGKAGSPLASSSATVRSHTPPNRTANSPQPLPARSSSEASVLPNTPGACSMKTPSLASARSTRRSASASALLSRARSATGWGPPERASGTPSSAAIARLRVASAPRTRFQSRSSAPTSLIRARL